VIGRLLRTLEGFAGRRVGVVGDMVADVYVYGRPQRLSREAPVMVVRYEHEDTIPGSAANTVRNLVALGASPSPVTLLGQDAAGESIREFFVEAKVDARGLLQHRGFATVTKTRIMAGDQNRTKQQVIRIDREPHARIPSEAEEGLAERFDLVDREVEAWIVSDYNYFVVGAQILARLTAIARKKPVIVDSRHRLREFLGARLVTPNEEEAFEAAGVDQDAEDAVEEVGRKLLAAMPGTNVLITRGNQGMMLFEASGEITSIPVVGGEQIVDVTGAGDTVTATAGLAVVAGASLREAAELANVAAGIVVMKLGAATCTREEIANRLPILQERARHG
jgi:rfaE bifunctional protein kinase chain/domain